MTQVSEWWRRVQTLQHQLYQVREHALKENDRETAKQCKQLLHESERMFKERAQSWIAEAEQVLDKREGEG